MRFEAALRRASTCEALRVRGGPTSAAGTGMGAQVWHLPLLQPELRPTVPKRFGIGAPPPLLAPAWDPRGDSDCAMTLVCRRSQ